MHVSGLRRRPVGVAHAEVVAGRAGVLVALGVLPRGGVLAIAVAAVERILAVAVDHVVVVGSVILLLLELLGEVVLTLREVNLGMREPAPRGVPDAVDVLVAEADDHDVLALLVVVLGALLVVVLGVVLIVVLGVVLGHVGPLGSASSCADSSAVGRERRERRERRVQGGHLLLQLGHRQLVLHLPLDVIPLHNRQL